VDKLFKLQCALVQFDVYVRLLLPGSEIIVSDIESDQDCQTEHVALRGGVDRRAHLLIDVRRKLRNVALVETAADRVPMSADLAGDCAHLRSSIRNLGVLRWLDAPVARAYR